MIATINLFCHGVMFLLAQQSEISQTSAGFCNSSTCYPRNFSKYIDLLYQYLHLEFHFLFAVIVSTQAVLAQRVQTCTCILHKLCSKSWQTTSLVYDQHLYSPVYVKFCFVSSLPSRKFDREFTQLSIRLHID